jgi:pSer/pThr/pTyr-binding forkhead associated (FHA) protein
MTFGRGRGVDLALDQRDLARGHAAVEFRGEGFELRDLDGRVGVALNGRPVRSAPLRPGDRFRIGAFEFEFALEPRWAAPTAFPGAGAAPGRTRTPAPRCGSGPRA